MNKEEVIVTKKALLNIINILDLSLDEAQEILSIRIIEDDNLNDSQVKRLLVFVDLLNNLTSICGTNIQIKRNWIRSHNLYFNCSPIEKLKSKNGLEEVRDYLYRMNNK
jgi:uncharacterized protein (DUF2384 family)